MCNENGNIKLVFFLCSHIRLTSSSCNFFFVLFSFLLSQTQKIESFHKLPIEIDLTQACVGESNTTLRGETNWPIIYGVGVNIKTGEIFPASFPGECKMI